MKTGKKGSGWSQLWRRNAVVAAVALFVCAAVYLNWSYEQEAQAGKTLGQSTMVGAGAKDPLIQKKDGEKPAQKPEEGKPKNKPLNDDGKAPVVPQKEGSGYFASARLNRKQARDSALSLLQDAAAKEDADAAVKKQVNTTIQTMADSTVTEAQIENLVLAKGYTDCVAFIGDDSLSLAVSAPAGGLSGADTAKLVDAVTQSSGFKADQIKIIEVPKAG